MKNFPEPPLRLSIRGEQFKHFPESKYTHTGYDKSVCVPAVQQLIEVARKLWKADCDHFVAAHGDQGSCVLGAGIAIWFKGPRKRTYREVVIISPPTSSQGSLVWEHGVENIIAWLGNAGLQYHYKAGNMD